MHVALTGASGFIGSVIARYLENAGHSVTALVRAQSRREAVEPFVERFVVGDQSTDDVWPELLDGADCLVHNSVDWAAIRAGDLDAHLERNLTASIRLIEAAGDRRVIFMSSIAVHHDMRPRWSGTIDEDHPTRPGMLYGAYKAAVEAHLWSAHFSRGLTFAALRPCAVYGVDPNLERSIGYPIVRQLQREGRYAKLGGGKFVHVEDVAAATVAALASSAPQASVCNLADCYARWGDLATMIGDLLGIDAEIDLSSPPQPKNVFTKDAARALGVPLDRGHAGLRAYLGELVERM